ncbi:patatin [Adhaeribacter arboris]|uniref:Patatin n=1 Tax=Adhaeribacter arboris TaxID=2072846 RepID=A0A2T2YBI7_9BACT|nr:patatin-like phospholipase family protein [Adhaeribacter arboris]PSR52869.1 patatin [Adhaeribacter arboris]
MIRFGLLVFVFISFTYAFTFAQTPYVYRNLVLEGGGIRGIAYGGALAELEQRAILPQIIRVAGTSAGAIQAVLLAVGYSPKEISDITFKTPIQKFTDGRFIFFGGFHRLRNRYGWYRGEKFKSWLERLIAAKTGNPHLTFAQLHLLAGINNCRDFYATGTNLTKQRVEIFSHETSPNMKISDAVRISMSIPLFFQAVFVDSAGNIIPNPKKGQSADILVDGGIIANYPLNLFDEPKYFTGTDLPVKLPFYNPETLGLRLDTDQQIAYDQTQSGLAPLPVLNFTEYVSAFYTMVIESLNRPQLQPEDWERTISVSTKGYGARIRRLSEKDKVILLTSGHEGVQQFFRNK